MLTPAYVFRKNESIGSADARDDAFLKTCFIELGLLDTVLSMDDARYIVVGRTGSGKSAIARQVLEKNERAIELDLRQLAINHLANNELLQNLQNAGVKLNNFYALLWQHIFICELINMYLRPTNSDHRNLLTNILAVLPNRDARKRQALEEYIQDWNDAFFQDTEIRVQEVTRRLQQEFDRKIGLEGKLTSPIGSVTAGLDTNKKSIMSEEEKAEVNKTGQSVVDSLQIHKLAQVIEILREHMFTDPMKRYYIVVDRLDEDWIDDVIKYKLIKSLLEASRTTNSKIRNVKVVVCLREDLLERVFRFTREAGFQEEKYNSLILRVKWNREELENLLDTRVNTLIRQRYTKSNVRLHQIAPSHIYPPNEKVRPADYIIQRTMLNPRDAINFLNECLIEAEGKAEINQESIMRAEASYSAKRLRALADEWFADNALTHQMVSTLRNQPERFRVEELAQSYLFTDALLDFIFDYEEPASPNDRTNIRFRVYHSYFENEDILTATIEVIKLCYRMGVVGVKVESQPYERWSYEQSPIEANYIERTTQCVIHPAFRRVLTTSLSNR